MNIIDILSFDRRLIILLFVTLTVVSSSGCTDLLKSGDTNNFEEEINQPQDSEDSEVSQEVIDERKANLTSLSLSSSNRSGEIGLTVKNTGSRPVEITNYTVYYAPPNYPNPVRYGALKTLSREWTMEDSSYDCLPDERNSEGSEDILQVGETFNCDTGIKYPGSEESVGVMVRANNFEYSTEITVD